MNILKEEEKREKLANSIAKLQLFCELVSYEK